MLLLALLIGWYAAYGASRQVVTDSRQGIRNTRERAGRRVGEIRKDRKASRVKRVAATGAVWTGQGAGVVWRGARHTGRTITTGVKWGAGEGRERYRERQERAEVRRQLDAVRDVDLSARERGADPAEVAAEYYALHEENYALRDQHRADRAERAGRPVPERVAARIDRRRAQTEAAARGDDPDRPGAAVQSEPSTHQCDGTCTSSNLDSDEAEARGLCRDCGGQGELVWNFGAEHGHISCRACNPDGPRWKRPRLPGQSSGEDAASPDTAQPYPLDGLSGHSGQPVAEDAVTQMDAADDLLRRCGSGINQHYPNAYAPDHPNTNGGTVATEVNKDPDPDLEWAITTPPKSEAERNRSNTNGGTTMTAPVTTANGTGLNGLRTAWTTFGGVAGEQVASCADTRGNIAALVESTSLTLVDAQATAAAAGSTLADLADSEAAGPEDIAAVEAQQAHAAEVVAIAERAVAAVDAADAALADLSRAAEAGQAQCAASLTDLNNRWAPTETFVQN